MPIELRRICFLCAIMVSLAHGVEARSVQRTLRWTIDGVERVAIVFAPRAAGPLPLLFVFHPHGGTAEGSTRRMHFQREWPEAIIVYPQGLNRPTPRAPGGARSGWQREAGQLHAS